MQAVKIVPKVRTTGEGVFDYAIPPELLPQIKIGVLVLVPFRGRKIEGIVVDLIKHSKITKLKSVLKIIDPNPVIDTTHLELAKWMSNYYLDSFSKTLFENIVPPARRIIKNTPEQYRRIDIKKIDIKNPKKYLIIGGFSARINIYLKAISQTLKQNKQVVIIVPDLSNISIFRKYIKVPMAILHAGLSITERYLVWQKIRNGDVKIIIGSNSAIFAPANNLGLVIIDQEENETYKNDRSPRFHVVNVAEKLCSITKSHLILGTVAPRVETYYKAKNDDFIIKNISDTKKPDISITNMNSEKSIISSNLENAIDSALSNKQKILLVLNRKGEGTKFSCTDCGFVMLCPKCQLPLIPQTDATICFHCEKEFPTLTKCPKCQSINLKAVGLGTKRLENIINKRWPKATTTRLELQSDDIKTNWDIAIATNFALKLQLPNINLVCVIDADQSINLPDYKALENSFITNYKFLKVGDRGIIQTHLPENPVIASLAKLDYLDFYNNEILSREKYHFPPYARLIRLLYKNTDEQKCIAETKRVFDSLNKITDISLLGPAPAFIKNKLGKYRYQIIIKLPVKKPIPENLKLILQNLRDWTLDVEPVDLL